MSHLAQFLEQHADEIISDAQQNLERSHLIQTEALLLSENRRWLSILFTWLVESIVSRDLSVFVNRVDPMAQTCFLAGFELHDLQVIFNGLEEALWKQIALRMAPTEMVEALSAVSTILGVGKDTVATTYVTLAAQAKEPALNVAALFKGT